MCFKGNTIRSSRRDRHENARPYVRRKFNFLEVENYVPDSVASKSCRKTRYAH